jgi:serine/threonine protein kinase
VKYIGVSSDPTTDFPVIAMELMRGNITRFLEQLTEPTPLCVQLDFSHDLAQALFYLQEKGIIHGNLSGTNVLLSEDGSVKVSDFEVLSLYPQVTVQQMGPKTLPYMPPEAFSVPPFRTEKVDSFSWGVLALQIITQLFPNPGPRVQTVTHPQSLARPLEMPVSEVSRRKSHIDLVNHSNPLLSVLVLCLDDIGERRPTMAEVCNIISLIKSSPDYKASQQQAGADWSKRHLFVMEYEPVSAVESSQQLNVRVHSQHQVHVEETGSRLNKLSLESEDMGGGESNGDVQHLVGVKNKGSNTDCGTTEEENDEDLNEPVKGKFTESEGTINGTPEPSAPSLQVDSELEATATAALPSLPPYSAIPSSQYAYSCPQPPEGQCATGDASPYEVPVSPPPYTLVPADHPQQPLPSAPPHNLVGPLQGVGDQPNVQTQGGLHDFHCAVCKHKSKYRQLPGQRISNVRCSKCKECTPVGAPAEKGKVYGRCAFCNCLMVYPSTAKRLTCPRQKCKEVIFTYTTTGKMMRRAPCEACHYVMQMVQDPDNISASTLHICSQCGEANFIGSAPPGFGYTRCPYCNVLIKHNSASLRVTCPRSTCQKVVEVGDGVKRSVKCDVCAKTVIYYGDRRVATCGHCGKSTVSTAIL